MGAASSILKTSNRHSFKNGVPPPSVVDLNPGSALVWLDQNNQLNYILEKTLLCSDPNKKKKIEEYYAWIILQ